MVPGRLQERLGAQPGVLQARQTDDPGDAPVAEGDEVVDDGLHRAGVIAPHRRQRRGIRRFPDQDCGDAHLGDVLQPDVLGPQVGDDDAVDATLRPPRASGLDRLLVVLDELQQQCGLVGGEDSLETRDQLHEERFDPQGPGRSCDHKSYGVGPETGEGAGRAAGSPADLRGDLNDALPSSLGHPGLAVQGVRDGTDRHASLLRNVGDGGAPGCALLPRHADNLRLSVSDGKPSCASPIGSFRAFLAAVLAAGLMYRLRNDQVSSR